MFNTKPLKKSELQKILIKKFAFAGSFKRDTQQNMPRVDLSISGFFILDVKRLRLLADGVDDVPSSLYFGWSSLGKLMVQLLDLEKNMTFAEILTK